METLATLLSEISYETSQKILDPKLKLLVNKINAIFLQIERSPDFQSVEFYLALLGQIQTLVTIIHLKYEKDVPPSLWKFAKDFDRIDDYETQQYLFEQIKNGHYKLL
jgi:hypothetical protein